MSTPAPPVLVAAATTLATASNRAHAVLSRQQQELLLRSAVLTLVCVLAFLVRLFAVLRYESVIHEFDPYFNYRSTRLLVERGAYAFWNWFDDTSWYPLGRIVGATVYNGIIHTAGALYWLAHALGFPMDVRNVSVFTSPLFAALTALVTYAFTREVSGGDVTAALLSSAFISVVPGYISRSVAGSFDCEAVAIFALVNTFYLFVRAVNTGSLRWSLTCCLSYFYMVSSWGGYVFVINLAPIYVLAMLVTGRYTHRLYVAYSTVYVLGTLMSMQVRIVGYQAVRSSEHMGAAGVFVLLQLYCFAGWVRSLVTPRVFRDFVRALVLFAIAAFGAVALIAAAAGYISPWAGRFYTLLDPTYARKHIPIIASVSEHQPTAWTSYLFDLHILAVLTPLGLYYCFCEITDANLFIILYTVFAVYFSGVMVRLMLVLAPAACVIGSIGLSTLLRSFMVDVKGAVLSLDEDDAAAAKATAAGGGDRAGGAKRNKGGGSPSPSSAAAVSFAVPSAAQQRNKRRRRLHVVVAVVVLLGAFFLTSSFVKHSTWATSQVYSSPSIVLAAQGQSGTFVIDDFREAYYWLGSNVAEDAKVASWWDYGYQIAGMGFRSTIVDNNTWNNSHIATVGAMMNQPEGRAHDIARMLDVDYVLVIFGGMLGFSGDDINKFLWMVRIGGSVDSTIRERDYLSTKGEYRMDGGASAAMRNSLMYKLSYYRFGSLGGMDRVRGVQIPNLDYELKYFEEVFTSKHWLVRIYRVKRPSNRGDDRA